MAPAWSNCLNIDAAVRTASPVATRIGATPVRISAWPRMSSVLVGSSIQYGLNAGELR